MTERLLQDIKMLTLKYLQLIDDFIYYEAIGIVDIISCVSRNQEI